MMVNCFAHDHRRASPLVGHRKPQLSAHERAGIDAHLGFLKYLHVGAQVARTWSPGVGKKDWAGWTSINWRSDLWSYGFNLLDIGKHFNAEMGFVPRKDIRRGSVWLNYKPRPKIERIRQLFFSSSLVYLTDHRNLLQTREGELSVRVDMEGGTSINVWAGRQFERLDFDWEIRTGALIPEGLYRWNHGGLSVRLDRSRNLSGRVSWSRGGYFSGNRTGVSLQGHLRLFHRMLFETIYGYNRLVFPTRSFSTNTLSERISYSLSPDLFAKVFAQWNDDRKEINLNFLIWYIYMPGSDFYLVYNERWGIGGGSAEVKDRTILGKITRLWNL